MAILLHNPNTGVTVTLPDALNWTDELWSPIVQAQTYTSTGAQYLEYGVKQAGRPYTLQGADDATWCTGADIATLQSWMLPPGTHLTLTIRGTARTVTWDHAQSPLQAVPVVFFSNDSIDSSDFYVPTLRLIEI